MAHSGVIEDVAWHQHHTDIFGSVGDDKQLILWDTRKPPREGERAWLRAWLCVWGWSVPMVVGACSPEGLQALGAAPRHFRALNACVLGLCPR
jgi:WD40 repeat protein